ncbi:MerC domain-containing protein [Microbulbifer sp. 2304DJ12-6]|uniref:MerC domain-containing protein n=1 Tax=Microbulbifer sp. 2304DJ12-6 TaxID=3233340 RepID=UPI002619215C|nr:MerC domain-containing protein [uncultured Microbulbifer sp.]
MRDIVGIFASGLCLVHCVLTPVLPALGGLGFLGRFLEEGLLHLALLVPALILALASFPTSCRHHQRHAIMVVGFSGALLLIVALYLTGIWEILVSIVGAGLLIMAHWINRRLILRMAPAD